MEDNEIATGRSLADTPTWSVASVMSALVVVGLLVHRSIERLRSWLIKTKRKALLAATEKIKDELMLFGLLSLLLGHWTIWVSKICIKSSRLSKQFYPCAKGDNELGVLNIRRRLLHTFFSSNSSVSRVQEHRKRSYCPEGREPFASYQSLEQLHRLLIVLGIIHVSYSFITIALAMLKIYSWKSWESQARVMSIQSLQGSSGHEPKNVVIKRQSTFIFHHASHPWCRDKVLIWILCFFRQLRSSISKSDYMALRLGFITNHNLYASYDFHSYMIRSMEEEFHDIVGISVPLWGYAIICILLNMHGINAYFWMSFIPVIFIVLVGTKLHHIVAKLALEVMDPNSTFCNLGKQLNPRDELFWFRKPRLLLWLIQVISFQNAFEMATFLWSLWEIKDHSCFMKNRAFLIIRLTFGIIFQFWCSYITFPFYVIITRMGSMFETALIAENVRESLHGWHRRVKQKSKHGRSYGKLATARSNTSLESMEDEMVGINRYSRSRTLGELLDNDDKLSTLRKSTFDIAGEIREHSHGDDQKPLEVSVCTRPTYDSSSNSYGDNFQKVESSLPSREDA